MVISLAKPCSCGCIAGNIGQGKAPHAACLLCADCHKWQQWLSKKALAQINIQENSQTVRAAGLVIY